MLESFSIVKTLYAFDFDGTLAPLTEKPDDSRMSDEVATLLEKLNSVVDVAIITGRSLTDLKNRLPFEPRFLIGNHGIEGIHDEGDLEKFQKLCDQWKKALIYLPEGAWVEDKKYSLSIHYKTNKQLIMNRVTPLRECFLIDGKNTINLIPVSGMNKGQALDILMKKQNLHFGFYIGDDKTDETVFAYKNSRLLTVKVGQNLGSYAKYYLESQSEIATLLRAIISFQKKLI